MLVIFKVSYFQKTIDILKSFDVVLQGKDVTIDKKTPDDHTSIKKNKCILDCRCSRHKTGNPKILKDIVYEEDGLVNSTDMWLATAILVTLKLLLFLFYYDIFIKGTILPILV